jgi:hypothetical protein
MSKYQPLGDYLRQQNRDFVPMHFNEIERIIGSQLPKTSQVYRAWWSNNPSNNVMTRVWLDAGYETEQVDMPGQRLVFRRVRMPRAHRIAVGAPEIGSPSVVTATPVAAEVEQGGPARRHPLFGALKGLLRIMPGTDLTKPADPTWGEK